MAQAFTYKVEVEFQPLSGILVDVSSRVESVVIARPRTPAGQGGTASSFEVIIQNHPITSAEVGVLTGVTTAHVGYCPFSPESPLGPWYPNVVPDRRVIISAFWSGGSSVRMFGWTDTWTPDAGERPPATAMILVTGSDVLSRYARRAVLSTFGEYALSGTGIKANYDYVPFDDDPDSTTVRILDQTGQVRAGTVVQPNKLPGSATLQGPDGGHLTDGQVDFARGDDNSPSPIVLVPLRPGSTLTKIEAWYRLTSDPLGVIGDEIICGYDKDSNRLWSWSPRIVAGFVQWSLMDVNLNILSFVNTGAPRTDGWHYWAVEFSSATTTAIRTADKGQSTTRNTGSFAWSYDPRGATYITIGGRMAPKSLGKISNTTQGSISSVLLQYSTFATNMVFGNPQVPDTAENVASKLAATTTTVDALVGGASTPAGELSPIMYTNVTRDLLSRWNELARTTGGGLTVDPSGARRYWRAADMRPTTVSLTLDAELDLSAPDGGWSGTKEEKPTRVTVTSPLGSFEVIDTATEGSTGLRLEAGTIDTAAGSSGLAQAAAGLILNAGRKRLNAFGVDLTTCANTLAASVMALLQNQRIRVQNLPAALEGVTYVDVFAGGITEVWLSEDQSVRFTFDTVPAEDYVEGYFDTPTEYVRFGLGKNATTVTGGTCVGNTGTGTVILTGEVLATTVGNFSLDLDWNGERITVSGVGGGTSPQTATVTVRGVAPSVARAHVAGEPVEVYHDLRFGV